jgi:hypothetical protein
MIVCITKYSGDYINKNEMSRMCSMYRTEDYIVLKWFFKKWDVGMGWIDLRVGRGGGLL